LQEVATPSVFYFGQTQTYTVSATTTYTQSIEASAGVGPVTAGWKAAFHHSSGTSNETTLSIITEIEPPLAYDDSCGLMVYFYIAPSLERTEWKLCDYNGDTLIHSRSLFFFQFTEPQLKPLTKKLTEFPNNSPYMSDLESYVGRNVQFKPGMEMLYRKELVEDIAGGIHQQFFIDFTNTITQSDSKSFEASLGIDANYLIFSASAGLTAGVEYERERTSTMSHSFELEYNNPNPINFSDSLNIRKYTTVAYIMKTTDSTAYYLIDGFEQYKPLFITYEVKDIEHGTFLFSIDENSLNKDKYNFFNYPNPCSDQSKFTWSLPGKSHINLSIYNVYGQKVSTPVNETQPAGEYQFDFYISGLANGIYYYRLLIDQDLITGKMIVNR